jgi:hypothetical protein
MKHLLLTCITCTIAALAPFDAQCRNAEGNPSKTNYVAAPLSFTENKGQVTDWYGKVRKDIDVKMGGGGLNIFIGSGEVHYQWSNVKCKKQNVKENRDFIDFKDYPGLSKGQANQPINQSTEIETYRMDVVLVGANKNALPVKEEEQKYYETYYTPSTGKNGVMVHNYSKVVYQDIYPHIDWVLYTKNNGLKYDFVVHPGGKVSDIRLRYEGATKLEIKEGALIATTPMGSITEAAPVSYEAGTGKAVDSRYILRGNVLRYEITGSSKNAIVIDPVLNWATYYGGGEDDLISAVATDGNDNAYITGHTTSSNNIATSGAFQSSFPGGQYASFLAKFDMNGNRAWSTYYGGGNLSYTYFNCLAVDAGGNLYAGGNSDVAGLATTGAYQTAIQGKGDALLVKFNNSGSRVWATYFGDVDSELVLCICTDVNNDVFIGGYMSGTSVTNMVTLGAFQTTPANGFIAKFSSNGAKQWCTSYGGNTCETFPTSLSCDAGDNLIVGGYTKCAYNIASVGSHQTTASGPVDGFIAKFNNSGTRLWATYCGGTSTDINSFDAIHGVATDPKGNIYAAGLTFKEFSGIATPGAWQTSNNGADDGFLVKFDPSGVRQWGTYFGSSTRDVLLVPVIGTDGYLYVAGNSNSANIIATTGATQTSFAGGYWDACLQVFTLSGQRVWGTYFGGPGTEFGGPYNFIALCTNSKGKVYLAGSTASATGIATPGAFQTALQNTRDGYLAKFDVNDLPPSGISQINQQSDIGIYPNPNDGRFVIKGKTTGNEPVLLQLINALGQTVYSATIQPQNGIIEHSISAHLAAGVYLLKAGSETMRVVVE